MSTDAGRGIEWWPNWYVTRLHAVVAPERTGYTSDDFAQPIALCGAGTITPARASRLEWQGKRMANGGPPRCKRCIAKNDTPHPEQPKYNSSNETVP